VAGRVGDDVLARAGREVAVGDVDGDALLALGLQAVGEQRQIDRRLAALFDGLRDGRELILEDGFRVVQQATDEGALAVVTEPAVMKRSELLCSCWCRQAGCPFDQVRDVPSEVPLLLLLLHRA
jgi:hypothetical protein